MFRFLFFLLLISQIVKSQDQMTPFEESEGRKTGTYEEVIAFYQRLSQRYPERSRLIEMGLTDSGKKLHLLIIAHGEVPDQDDLRSTPQTRILVNNGIHPGEPDGIEASMMLARDMLKNHSIPESVIICIIPVYNIGGALNRNGTSRVNQNGPESYGFRGNARNYDLNRDFIKSDTRNTQSFYELFHLVEPDIFVDTHVSNGADYQYPITHLATQHNRIGGSMGRYIYEEFTPSLEKAMDNSGYAITPYVNVFNRTPDERGFSQFMDSPRYSTGYTTLFGTLGFMIETHMLKPFDIRVHATYAFLENIIALSASDGRRIRAMRQEVMQAVQPGKMHTINWELDRDNYRNIQFRGYEGKMIESNVTGLPRLMYDRTAPFERRIPYYDTFKPVDKVIVPKAYIIPQGWHHVILRLIQNGASYERFSNDTTILVETYRIAAFKPSSSPYEGHYPHRELTLEPSTLKKNFREGDYLFSLPQKAGRYLVETLEPKATDSFFRWNFFDTILQRKEGFSPYVFEDLAEDMLNSDPDLQKEFETKQKEDSTFAGNWYLQLNFIYENSKYREKAHSEYPVYRLVE